MRFGAAAAAITVAVLVTAVPAVASNGNGNGASANAAANQQGPQNDNASVRVGQPGSNNSVAQGNDASSAATAHGNANGNGNGASATAAQASPTNANVVVRVDSPGATGDVTQANTSSATASGADDDAPAPTGAGSSAATASTVQTDPANTNLDVRVNSPGDGGSVSQSNTATATTASSAADPATATATQTTPTNLNVAIRVGSSGNNGTASQTNAAQAGPPATATEGPAQSVAPSTDAAATQQTVTTSGTAESSNTSGIDESIEQTQGADAPLVTPSAENAATSETAPTAVAPPDPPLDTVEQTGPQNINVSIRIASPGTDHAASQADKGPVDITAGANADVQITVPGDPTAVQVGGSWVWTWTWSADWSPAPGDTAADVAPTGNAAWNWNWQPAADVSPGAGAPQAPADGTWSWSWTWTLPSGDVWVGGWQRPCDCSWTWNWNWDWASATPATPQAPVDASDAPPQPASGGTTIGSATQQNSVSASATATVSGDVTQAFQPSQISAGPGDGQLISANQALDGAQEASATATAAQSGATNLNVDEGVATASTLQTNAVTAAATAAATITIDQAAAQQQDGDGSGPQSESAAQTLSSVQGASADSVVSQQDAQNTVLISSGPDSGAAMTAPIEQWNVATATASAAVDAELSQWTVQLQTLGTSLAQEADATQTLTNAQTALASGLVSQVRTANLADIHVPAGSSATNPPLVQLNAARASATATDGAVVHQTTVQSLGGTADIELALATQDAANAQNAFAFAPAAQSDLVNRSGWLGVEPPPVSPPLASEPTPPAPAQLEIEALSLSALASPSPPPIVWVPGLPALGPLPHGAFVPPTAVAWTSGSAPPLGAAPIAETSSIAHGASAVSPRATRGDETGEAGAASLLPLLLTSGAAGSGPHGGGAGAVAVAARRYEFVAPGQLGPRCQGSALGRPVDFTDPIERPG